MLLLPMQRTTPSIGHVPGHHRTADKHSCCSILRVPKHRHVTTLPVCSHSGTQEWPPEQGDADSRGPTQLSVRLIALLLRLLHLRCSWLHACYALLAWLCCLCCRLCDCICSPLCGLQHRAQRHLELLRAARMQLQQAQDQRGLRTVSQAPAQEADTSPSRQNGAAVQVPAVPSRQELQGTSAHVARHVYNEVANSRNRLSKRLSAANKVGAPAVRCLACTVPALLPPCPAHWCARVRCLMPCRGAGQPGPRPNKHARSPLSPAPVCTAL